jgi:hypothetical protein
MKTHRSLKRRVEAPWLFFAFEVLDFTPILQVWIVNLSSEGMKTFLPAAIAD